MVWGVWFLKGHAQNILISWLNSLSEFRFLTEKLMVKADGVLKYQVVFFCIVLFKYLFEYTIQISL